MSRERESEAREVLARSPHAAILPPDRSPMHDAVITAMLEFADHPPADLEAVREGAAKVCVPTIDSSVYKHTFYGILNAQGQFWTPLPFHDESAARSHLARWAVGSHESMLETHKIVPVRIQLSAIDIKGEKG